ncbi:MAG: 30S ribosomal protein S18 [Parcubacteria group bacterium GW2011_GWA1_42_7]|nr:MAG: 30S ribosomal protein S18 [Parcubacteria group bacterium GW2011_GWA1_42_7]
MEKSCYFCQENIQQIDFKDTATLRNFLSGQGKILPPRRTGVCRKHQRALAQAIKRARAMALLSFVSR